MDFNAFDIIRDNIAVELEKQGFRGPDVLESEDGRAEMFKTDEVAYSLQYNRKRARFELRSTTLTSDGEPGDWRNLSIWLFDEEEGTKADVQSISNDFVEVISGPKRVALVQQKKKRKKDEEKVIDPLFFFNRLAGIFPELKEDMNNERISYGQVRFATLAKEKAAPKCENLAVSKNNSDNFTKLCTLFEDMYKDGDMDLRSIITISILNNVSNEAFENIKANVGKDLEKALKFSRKLIGKTIKPEKKKKDKKRVMATLNDRR